jgi:hypothetical protein
MLENFQPGWLKWVRPMLFFLFILFVKMKIVLFCDCISTISSCLYFVDILSLLLKLFFYYSIVSLIGVFLYMFSVSNDHSLCLH